MNRAMAERKFLNGIFAHALRRQIEGIDPVVVVKKIVWNMVLLFLGLFIGFVIVQHAMFYAFPPNLDAFIYVQKEVYLVFSIIFVLSIRTLSYVESRIRGLKTS